MTAALVPLKTATISQDETTKAVLCALQGTIEADVINADMTQLTTPLANILAKLSADPATQTTLAAILAKLIAAPATEAKQDTAIAALTRSVAAAKEPGTPVSVDTAGVQVVAANASRIGLILSNNSAEDITLYFGDGSGGVTPGSGAVLKAGGPTYVMDVNLLYTGVIYAVHHGSSGSVYLGVVEFGGS